MISDPQPERIPLRHVGRESLRCYACATDAKFGLHTQFYWVGDRVEATWTAGEQAEGWAGLVHGCVFSALHDEAAAWSMMMICATTGFTTHMDIRYKRPIHVGDRVLIRGRVVERHPRKGVFATEILAADGSVCSTATVEFAFIEDINFLEKVTGAQLSPEFITWMKADTEGRRAMIAEQARLEGIQ